MTLTEDQLKAAHKDSLRNIKAVTSSEICGCFHCLKVFNANEIKLWYNETKNKFVRKPKSDDCTAFCPYCETDSVLGSNSGHPMTRDFLKQMQIRWFDDFED
jgi:hypothetical protein